MHCDVHCVESGDYIHVHVVLALYAKEGLATEQRLRNDDIRCGKNVVTEI